MLNSKPQVLIIKLGAIGDVALALPLVSFYKGSCITWVTGKASEELIKAIPAITHVLIADESALLEGSFLKKCSYILKLWTQLLFKKFDVVITAHKDPRYKLLSLTAFKKKHLFFDKKASFPISGKFHSLEYLNLVGSKNLLYPVINLPNIDYLIKEKIKPLILLNISGETKNNRYLRHWPMDNYVSLAKLLAPYATIVLIGDKKALELSNQFSSVLNLVGKTTILQLIALCKKAIGIITHDSGPLHLARLGGCKICALFGPTSPLDFSINTDVESSLWEGAALGCSPCYRGKNFPFCSHHSCLKLLTPEKVFFHLQHSWKLKNNENSNCS